MKTTPTAAQPELRATFAELDEIAQRVQSAHARLQESAWKLDRDVADANRRLARQVAALENLSGSLAAVLRAIPCGVVVTGGDGAILMANPAAEQILGRTGAALLGAGAADLKDDDGEALLLLPGGPCEPLERRFRVNGEARVVDDRVVAVKDAAGNPLGLVELLADRAEVKALQEEVRRLDRLAELGRVAAIIAHEIRNPLSGIRGFAGLLERRLKDAADREEELRWSRRIIEGAGRADAIIDSVLFLARPRPLSLQRIELEPFLLDCLECVASADAALVRGVQIDRRCDPAGLCVLADPVRLQQALTNLIQNALESLKGKRGRKKLELSARQSSGRDERSGRIEIGVADDGPGIAPDALGRLFEPFFTTKNEGAGLGLALVARIAELHGGKVEAKARPGGGACFTLSLPAAAKNTEAWA